MRYRIWVLSSVAVLAAFSLSNCKAQEEVSEPDHKEAASPAPKEVANRDYIGTSGPFKAVLVPIDEADLVEFNKPEHGGPRLVIKDTAICGDKVAIKFTFQGMTVTAENHIDVTYDLKILKPDGSLYKGKPLKGGVAHKGQVARPDNIYNNNGFIVLPFKPDDLVGNYEIITTVYDNIGKRQVNMKRNINLLACDAK